jgi:hypothetical protein
MNIGIQGLGFISPWGDSFEGFSEKYQGRDNSAFGPIDRFDSSEISVDTAALVRDFDPKKYIDPKKVRKYDVFSRLGISVSKLALDSAGREFTAEEKEDMGIVLSCESQNMITAEYLDVLCRDGVDKVSPKTFSVAAANSANCSIAMETDIHGPSVNVSSHFASGFLTVYTAAQLIRAGQAEQCLAGSLDHLSKPVMECYTRMKAYRGNAGDGRGFLPGEGSAGILLTSGKGLYGKILGLGYQCSSQKNYLWPKNSTVHQEVLLKAIGDHKVDKFQSAENGDKTVERLEREAYDQIFGMTPLKPEKVYLKSHLGEFSALSHFQIISACCEPKGTKTLISVVSVGGVHAAILVESNGFKGMKNAVGF